MVVSISARTRVTLASECGRREPGGRCAMSKGSSAVGFFRGAWLMAARKGEKSMRATSAARAAYPRAAGWRRDAAGAEGHPDAGSRSFRPWHDPALREERAEALA